MPPTDDDSLETLRLERASPDEPLTDSVYRSLRKAIADGRLTANTKLAQIPLAEQFGISRTPVRDALQRLSQEGLVRTVSYRGFRVNEFNAREVLDVYGVRLALEPVAVRGAVEHHNHLTIARMLDNCEETEGTAAEDVPRLFELNREFHTILVSPCENALFVRLLEQLWQMPTSSRVFEAQAADGSVLKASAEEHRLIVEPVRERDVELAVERVTEHIRKAQQETIKALTSL